MTFFQVVEAYLFPTIDENREKFSWGTPEVESLREYAKKTFGWTKKRTDEIILPVMKRLSEKTSQQSIQNYFKITGVTSRKELKVSKRVRTALEHMDPEHVEDEAADDIVKEKKPRKKATKKTAPKTEEEKEGGSTNDSNVDTKPKPKPRRKRKAIAETETDAAKEPTDSNTNEPCTSATVSISVGAKKVVLPDNNEPIPQREKDKQIMESNRLKAIEVLKKMKANRK